VKFEPTAPPHLRPHTSISRVMGEVLLALVPATIAWVWYFGPGILYNMAVAAAVALLCEAAALRLRGREAGVQIKDLSALVTAVLLAFCLPPLTPWWITATGAAFAILLAKQLYGGLGYNPFNPAMAGYVVLLISFPEPMTRWLPPLGEALGLAPASLDAWQTLRFTFTGALPEGLGWDTISGATPLDDLKTQLSLARTVEEVRGSALYGSLGARGWEWTANWIGLGGLYLLARRIIRWQIPVAVILGVCVPATLFWLIDPGSHAPPTFHLFSGATLLGAFFIATDPVSAATSRSGRLLYGFGIGLLIFVIRAWGGYPDGVAFAVLLMNMAVPAIDHFTRPRTYGHAN
jgi:Na+-translocating ferredoxin:NAD+ oxidoreductase subunit D